MDTKRNGSVKKRRSTRMQKNDRLSNRLAIFGITLVVISMAFVFNVKRSSMELKDDEYRVKEENLQTQVESESDRAKELEEERIYVQTKQYIEKVAKEKLGMVYPDEIVIKPAD